ncbi:ras-related protein Rab-36 [Denticeps clupeoides]|uniref:Ras-related protein Rab-36 n=1 Tax=Denticeps clupeoides TaxID=299321 RepID=A0AAY4A8N6_9TELE|nr:ras-related protein Rab-36-like [Denticeps clupeoides]
MQKAQRPATHRSKQSPAGVMRFVAPVSRDRVIRDFPKCYDLQACLQMKTDWNTQAKKACRDRTTAHQGWDRTRMSKVVVVGDLNVGKTCLINRFCKDAFDRDYKATIGVDFEVERFEIAGLPFSLQIWDTAGQEKFKCIASAYYRGAQVIVTAFDMSDIKTLDHTRQWLTEALKENEPSSCSVFLVGTKNDLLSPEARLRTEIDAVKVALELQAEFWSLSSKTGENVKEFFFRVAALAFEDAILKELEGANPPSRIGEGSILSDTVDKAEVQGMKKTCC